MLGKREEEEEVNHIAADDSSDGQVTSGVVLHY